MKPSYGRILKRNLLYLLSLTLLINFQPVSAQITATQMGMLDFKEDQSLSSTEMDGTIDVTEKLQAAVNNARTSNKTLFIPSGTYKVSNTINCILTITNWVLSTPVNIIGSSLQHPVIKLADNCAIFNGINPKAVIHYQNSNPDLYGTDAVMEGGIRAIDFDLGVGNTSAVALYWGCAQYCYIEDININAHDGFAGLTGIGGANNLLANISVTGGKHGLYLTNYNEGVSWGMQESPQNTITGCSFTDQTDVSVVLRGWGGITLIGTSIIKDSGLAIRMDCETYAAVNQFPLSVIDSKIEFTNPQSSNIAVKNLLRGNVSLRGVYVKGAGMIVDTNGDEDVISEALLTDWTCLKRFDYVDKSARNDESGNLYIGTHYNAITGIQFKTAIIDRDVSTPPANLTSKHIWSSTPSFEDPDAVLVTTASEIQTAINGNRKVCLAKGTYTLSAPLILKANTILLGCPGLGSCGSVLKYGWTPATQTWLIETENKADATTYLMDICTDPGNANYLGSLHWQAGMNSIIRTVRFDKSWDTFEKDLIRMYFSGNGGGRVFNYQDEKGADGLNAPGSNSVNHRKVKVSGTSQQLTFYGLNLERGGSLFPESSFPLIEMTNSSNIRIFGAKSETFQPYAIIYNCNDVFLTNLIDYCANGKGTTKQNYIEITGNSDSIEITNAMFLYPPNSTYKIVADPWNSNEPSRNMHIGLYHRHWSSVADTGRITVGVTDISADNTGGLRLFPNPATTILTFELSEYKNNEIIQIYNSVGDLINEVVISSSNQQINIGKLQKGIYFVRLKQTGNKSIKFIKI